MFRSLKNWLKDKISKFTFKDWVIVLTVFTALALLIYGNYWKNKSLEYYNQRGIYSDSLTVYKNKLGEEYAAKNTLIMDKATLKKYNDELWEEYKKIKDNPLVLTNTVLKTEIKEIEGKHDTTYIAPNIQNPELKDYTFEWSAKDSVWYMMQGVTKVSGKDVQNFSTRIPEFRMNSNLKLNLIETKENLQVVAKTDNPYINIDDISSVVIDPRKSKTLKKYFPQKRWGIGPQVGVGLTSDLKFRPYIGVGIQYSIINF